MAGKNRNDTKSSGESVVGSVEPTQPAPVERVERQSDAGVDTIGISANSDSQHGRGGFRLKPGVLAAALKSEETKRANENTQSIRQPPKVKRETKRKKAEAMAFAMLNKMESLVTNITADDSRMDTFERELVEPSLAHYLETADTEMLERFNGILTPAALIFGMGLYGFRIMARERAKFADNEPPPPPPRKDIPSPKIPPAPPNGVKPQIAENLEPSKYEQWSRTLDMGN